MPLTPEQFETLIDAANEAWNEKVTLQSILTAILPLHRAMVIEEVAKAAVDIAVSNPDKALQATQNPNLEGWFVGQLMNALTTQETKP